MPPEVTCWVTPVVDFVTNIWAGLGPVMQKTIIFSVIGLVALWIWRRK